MPHDAVTVRQDVLEGDPGQHDIVILSKYVAPADGDGNVEFDVHKDYDMWCAARAMSLLMAVYPGHFWAVESDVKQHILKIGIPILMGICNWYVINLRQTELTPGAILVAGGEILERYRLRRGRLEIASFLEARANHSALVNRRRPVPE